VEALEGLAAAGALACLGVERRQGLWAAGALAGMGPGRLALAEGTDPPHLPGMSPFEEMGADLWATGVSVRHPVEFVRAWLAGQGCLTVAEVVSQRRARRVAVGGVITHRQRPMTARGVIFMNLEDETGLLNVVVLPPVWEANRETARKSVGVVVEGVVESRDGVTNLVARRFSPWPEEVRDVRTRNWA
jgi:error-prone DNA polymerase